MKKLRVFLGVLFVLCMLTSLITPAMAEGYTYTVRVFAGAHGTIDGEEMVVYTDLPYGSRVNFDISRVSLDENSKYYVKGIRESGRDNNTVSEPSIYVTEDIDYVVAYGIKGSSVAYTVNYMDADGNTLYPSATFYGNVGDRPVMAFQYIDGYHPQAYNLTKTLSENASENVFTFIYSRIATDDEPNGDDTTPADTEPMEDDDNNKGEVLPPDTDIIPDDNQGSGEDDGPGEVVDLDDSQTPKSNFFQAAKEAVEKAAKAVGNWWSGLSAGAKIAVIVGAALLLILLLVLLILLLLRRRKKDEEDEDEVEEDDDNDKNTN